MDEFLGTLTTAGASYVVLRWFETLPEIERGGDIDMLVADEDLPVVERLLTPFRPRGEPQEVDLYTVGGLPRTRFGNGPYFPRRLAERVLDGATLLKGRYRVPNEQDHFDSLAFHAVHQKGRASGLPPRDGVRPAAPPGGKLPVALERLRASLGLDVELSIAGLARYLEERGLAPDTRDVERYGAVRHRLYGE